MTPYSAPTRSDSLGQHMTRVLVSSTIPILGLFLLRTVLASLPMLRNAGPIADWGVTPLVPVKAAIDSVVYFLILRGCLSGSHILKSMRPQLAEIGTVVLLTGCTLVATLAYSGYENLMGSLAPTQVEMYNWIFLALVLTPIALIVVMVTRRLDFFSDLVFGKLHEAMVQPQAAAWNPARSQAPPAGPPPPVAMNPAQAQMQDRVEALLRQGIQARNAADRLDASGALPPELAESPAKLQHYLAGAQQSVANRDLNAAKSFADWAEYEASRLLAVQ